MHLEPQHAFRSGIINYFIINIYQSQRPDVWQVKDTDDWLLGGQVLDSDKTLEMILIGNKDELKWTESNHLFFVAPLMSEAGKGRLWGCESVWWLG